MGYRLRKREAVQKGIRRVVRECLADARATLVGADQDPHRAVHEARKRIKEIRAVLRLVREPLGKHYARENAWYRETAAGLSPLRDAGAMVEAFSGLISAGHVRAAESAQVLAALEARRDKLVAAPVQLRGAMAQAAERFGKAESRVRDWRIEGDFDALGHGLQTCYAGGRRRFDRARRRADDEALHAWRKRVKDYWYQTRLLQGVWPALLSVWQGELKQLSDLLGDEHDVTILVSFFEQDGADFAGEHVLQPIIDQLRVHQTILREQAWQLGGKLYAESPQAYLDRIGALWSLWRE